MNVLEHLSHTLADLLRDDSRRVVLGEDVIDGGMLGLTRACAGDDTLARRLLSTPLAPSALVAHAAGLALGGRRPIVVHSSLLALVEGLAGLREAALLPHRSGTPRALPMLLLAPSGPGFGLGGEAVEGLEAVLARVPRLRVLCVGSADEASAWLRAAASFEDGESPTVLLLPRRILLSVVEQPAAALMRPCAEPHRVRDGRAATVFTWGETVGLSLAAVDATGIDAAVVDIGCLAPFSVDALVREARATGKIVIAHAGPAAGGLGAELAALFSDRAILHLDAPITRVTGADAPLRAAEESAGVPSVARLAEAIVKVAQF
jgi:pyruvate/2-oxoglutarate/acetoin dehydrogenase E1 component